MNEHEEKPDIHRYRFLYFILNEGNVYVVPGGGCEIRVKYNLNSIIPGCFIFKALFLLKNKIKVFIVVNRRKNIILALEVMTEKIYRSVSSG